MSISSLDLVLTPHSACQLSIIWFVPSLPASLNLDLLRWDLTILLCRLWGVSWDSELSVPNSSSQQLGWVSHPPLRTRTVYIASFDVVQLSSQCFDIVSSLENVFCIKLGRHSVLIWCSSFFLTSHVYLLAYKFIKLAFFLCMFNLFSLVWWT